MYPGGSALEYRFVRRPYNERVLQPSIHKFYARSPRLWTKTSREALASAIRSISFAVGQPSLALSSKYVNQAAGRSYRISLSSLLTTSNVIASLSGASNTALKSTCLPSKFRGYVVSQKRRSSKKKF